VDDGLKVHLGRFDFFLQDIRPALQIDTHI
jgi:hypothetical protein